MLVLFRDAYPRSLSLIALARYLTSLMICNSFATHSRHNVSQSAHVTLLYLRMHGCREAIKRGFILDPTRLSCWHNSTWCDANEALRRAVKRVKISSRPVDTHTKGKKKYYNLVTCTSPSHPLPFFSETCVSSYGHDPPNIAKHATRSDRQFVRASLSLLPRVTRP